MNTNFKNLLDFVSENEGQIFSSPRALFGKGEEELFTIENAGSETEEISLNLENNQKIVIKYRLIEEAVLLLEDKEILPIYPVKSSDNILSAEEHLKIWQSGTDNTILNVKIVPYILDLIVLFGFGAYGWAKSGTGDKFAAIAIAEKKHKKQTADDENIKTAEPKESDDSNDSNKQNEPKESDDSNDSNEQNEPKETKASKEPIEPEDAVKNNDPDEHGGHENDDDAKGTPDNEKKQNIPVRYVSQSINKDLGHVLIAYSTKHGSTADIAWSIKNSFLDEGIITDVKRIQDIDDVRKYNLVIIGTPVYDNKLLPETVEFVRLHRNWLLKRMTALFIVGISLKEKNDENILNMSRISDEIGKLIDLLDVGMFAGKISPENLPFRKRLNKIFNKEATGDFRNWQDIGEWADKMKKLYLSKII